MRHPHDADVVGPLELAPHGIVDLGRTVGMGVAGPQAYRKSEVEEMLSRRIQ